MTLSIVCLIVGVLAYGWAGARLSDGAQGEAHPLKSPAWWMGTALQGAGFFFTLLARGHLPLLIVQAAVVGGLAITALIQHLAGTRALKTRDVLAIGVVVAGIAVLAATTVPGPAVPIEPIHVAVLGAGVAICLVGVFLPLHPGVFGVLSGLGFAISAIAARLLIARLDADIWRFWEWPWTLWAGGFLLVGGLVLGQVHLTRGLAVSHAVGVLGANYVTSTIVPAAFGLVLMHELPRQGMMWAVVAGLVLSLAGALSLLRPDQAEPAAQGLPLGEDH
ncbi:hypothetical protein [Mobilicoccus massiliensis]|uniref:hypothetical protein n=1 Tax=Mobilicoccus massiliensis TaxID=1522310 RepID=UPI0005901880|nr:hypothetical protein [Mobilicoccus massiliensis]